MRHILSLFLILIASNSFAQTFYSETSIKTYWETNGMDNIEGIYESTGSYKDTQVPCTNGYGQTICYVTWRREATKYKVALIKLNGAYKLLYLSGKPKGMSKVGGCNCDGKSYIAPQSSPWRAGDTKAKLYKTATPGFYKCDWYMGNKSINSDGYISFEKHGYFTLLLKASDQDEAMYLKLYPTADDNVVTKSNKSAKSSGSGFAISSSGYIVTNQHVVDGASKISIRGIKGNFSKVYNAKVIVEDKNNDLAIIKIDDQNFTSLGVPPYKINNGISAVGNSVYALGYPLRATMGDEVKLTDGIISSKSGFQGDITTYQITVPVQPGNSGGPLFDTNGNIIGIINAKHIGAENASYAIKTSYLMNLIQAMNSTPKLPSSNIISSKSLSEQVKFIKEFVYIIETE